MVLRSACLFELFISMLYHPQMVFNLFLFTGGVLYNLLYALYYFRILFSSVLVRCWVWDICAIFDCVLVVCVVIMCGVVASVVTSSS